MSIDHETEEFIAKDRAFRMDMTEKTSDFIRSLQDRIKELEAENVDFDNANTEYREELKKCNERIAELVEDLRWIADYEPSSGQPDDLAVTVNEIQNYARHILAQEDRA